MSPFLRAVEHVGGGAAAATAIAGVAAVWVASGMLFSALLWLTGGAVEALPPGGVERLAVLTLLAAAAYQVSSLAQACQRLCAQPYALLARRWRGAEGWRSAAISPRVSPMAQAALAAARR
jgi:predicted metal-binding membrane protein